jgi:hypothetical protein
MRRKCNVRWIPTCADSRGDREHSYVNAQGHGGCGWHEVLIHPADVRAAR